MHTIKDRPVVVDGQIVIRPIMVVALTYDHRLLDGREAVTFLGKNLTFLCIISFKIQYGLRIVKVKEYLEDPAKMLLAA
jgi:2-oxoglutarate dehydrogenase E2 component (dihydrolipoamide succinyltransferase)